MMYTPLATYRIQFSPSFPFKDARKILDYLKELGVSDVYASPIFLPRELSEHGYDVVDQNTINPELGGLSEFNELIEELHNHDMGWIQDIVPNHMAFDSRNTMLMDVMENGPHSRYFGFFDFQWDHPYERIRRKILAPFLGKFYGEALEDGEIVLRYSQEGLSVHYYNFRLPVRIESYTDVLTHRLDELKKTLGEDHPDFVKLLGVLYAVRSLTPEPGVQERYDQIHFIKRMLWDLYNDNPDIEKYIDDCVQWFNGTPGESESFDALYELLNDQFYRLAFWKVGTEEINYRRFFNLNEFISMNMDDVDVFRETNRLLFELVEEGKIQGLRVDHVDGLFNPRRYFKRLRNRFPELYLVVEKILEHNEALPEYWPVQGTTGYDFLNHSNGVLCQKEHRIQFDKIYRKFTGFNDSYDHLIHEKKRLIIGKHMAGDVDNLAHTLARIAGKYRYGSDFTLYGLRRSLVEILAWFPVYRTYISEEYQRDEDLGYIREAVDRAKSTMPDFIREFDFIYNLLSLQFTDNMDQEEREQWLDFVMRFQQLTGPLMAKGFEDTVLYIYNRLLSLNEVGGYPDNFGTSEIEFHQLNRERCATWPQAMNSTSTHDTKRGEDMRARLNVLSEIPLEWEQQINHWSRLNEEKKEKVRDLLVPDPNDEYLLYQTLIGTFPFDGKVTDEYIQRIKDYIIKAVRESKIHTEWLKPDSAYEGAFTGFVEKLLDDTPENTFLEEFRKFQQQIVPAGILNSLSQTLLKMTSPGIPDFYQGSELWNLHLVDPDNRRAVDYSEREKILRRLKKKETKGVAHLWKELFENKEDGRVKLYLIYRILHTRAEYRTLFEQGKYVPLKISGARKNHVVAFARKANKVWAVTAVPRFPLSLTDEGEIPFGKSVWQDTAIEIPDRIPAWKDHITDSPVDGSEELSVASLFKNYPGALLIGQSES